jgi:hypothetical protein
VDPIKELADELFRERVRRARETPPEEKLMDGPRLFDLACKVVADGIRHQYPDADEQQVQKLLAERVALMRRLEESR